MLNNAPSVCLEIRRRPCRNSRSHFALILILTLGLPAAATEVAIGNHGERLDQEE